MQPMGLRITRPPRPDCLFLDRGGWETTDSRTLRVLSQNPTDTDIVGINRATIILIILFILFVFLYIIAF